MEKAYPLQWPMGRQRTKEPTASRFDTTNKTPNQIQNELVKEIVLMNGRNIVVSTNMPIRQDGLPYSRYAEPSDQGVAVYFERDGNRVCFACDQYDKIWKNMRAITKTIEAMRGIERWGSKEMLDRAFTGFAALPSPESVIEMPNQIGVFRTWFEVLSVDAAAEWSVIRTAYREAMRDADDTTKLALNLAYEQAKKVHNN